MIRLLLLSLLFVPVPLAAADRRVGLSSFDRLRAVGPIEVEVAPGSPSAVVSGDPRMVERVELRVDGTTLSLRLAGAGWNLRNGDDRREQSVGPVRVVLRTPRLSAVTVFGGTRVSARRVSGERVDLSVSGAGRIAVDEVGPADQLGADVIGAGEVVLSGRARRARLLTNGPGRIDAGGLVADELFVRLDGPGETRAAARYRAEVVNTGVGTVAVAGNPDCRVRAPGGGPVRCGGAR